MTKKNNHTDSKTLKQNILESQLIRVILSNAVYDTMWRMVGFRELDEMPDKGEEGVSGRKYSKGLLYAPRSMVTWDVDTVDNHSIPTERFNSRPVTIDEFTKQILAGLEHDGATLLFQEGISTGRQLDTRTLMTIATHLTFGNTSNQNGDRVKGILKTLTPRYITQFGGRKRVFAALSVCLSYLDQYIEEMATHYHSFWKKYMPNSSESITGASGKNLAQPHIVSWSGTRYQDQYGGLVSIGGYEKRGTATLNLESVTSRLKDELGVEEFPDEALFASYQGANTRRDLVAVYRRYRASRWGVHPRKIEAHLIKPEELGLDQKNLAQLTEESASRYKKILDVERIVYPNL